MLDLYAAIPTPAALSEHVMEGMVGRLGRQALFEVAAESLHSVLPFDVLGLARVRRGESAWEQCAVVDRRSASRPSSEPRFTFAGTAGAWVASRGTPFVGTSLRRVQQFPHTYASLQREGMASNAVIPVRLHGEEVLVLYALARREGAFRESLRESYRDAVQQFAPLLVSCAARARPAPAAETTDETLDGVQTRHIRAVLDRCGGVIEGDRGAADALGIKPSTLRHRMRKLGIGRS